MIVHSKEHVTKLDDKCVQPNAVDIRASQLYVLQSTRTIVISEDKKDFADRIPAAIQIDNELQRHFWIIPPRSVVEYLTEHETEVPEGHAGFINIRSTLARNGLISQNGIYDQGYKGFIGGTLHNNNDHHIMLEVGCRVAQYYMIKSEGDHLYNGHYNQTRGLTEPTNAS